MLQISKNANPNYLAKILYLPEARKHSNADRLQCFTIDFQNVITDLSYQQGDKVVYFPVECSINESLISFINGFEDKTRNNNKELKGFFNKHGRVRAISLRGEKSQGFILKAEIFEEWLSKQVGVIYNNSNLAEFDSYGDLRICWKYVAYTKQVQPSKNDRKIVKKISRLVENQFRLHNDTENLRKNADKIRPSDYIGVHYKKHGTSWVVGNVLTKRKLSWVEKLLLKFGIRINTEVYDYVYSSRNVVKNEFETQNSSHYFGYDLWADIKEKVKEFIPKGMTLYGEFVGYDKNGAMIQKGYDYGCKQGEGKIYVYRITMTNPDGLVTEYDDMQIKEYCEKYGLLYSDTLIYYGRADLMFGMTEERENFSEKFVKALDTLYKDKDCYMCANKVPAEGIVVRKHSLSTYEAYKLKTDRFLEKETKDLDEGILDLETEQSLVVSEI